MIRNAIDCAASLFAPRVLSDHDRAAVVSAFREAMPSPLNHTYRVRGVQDASGMTMGFHHKVRVCKPDGSMDLLFIPRVQITCFCDAEHVTPEGVMVDLSGNGCHLYPGPNGGGVPHKPPPPGAH